MKIQSIVENLNKINMLFERALTEDEFEVPYDYIKRREINNVDDLEEFIEEAHSRYPRTKGSLKFLAVRMNMMIHGYAPQGLSPHSWKKMFANSENKKIKQYILSRDDFEEADLHDIRLVTDKTIKRFQQMEAKGDEKTKGYSTSMRMVNNYYDQGLGNLKKVLPKVEFENKKHEIAEYVMSGWTLIKAFQKVVPDFEYNPHKKRSEDKNTTEKLVDKMLTKYIKDNSPRWLDEKKLRKVRSKALEMDSVTASDINNLFSRAKRNKL